MIPAVDEALRTLLGRELPGGAQVRLDVPTPTWHTERPSTPTVQMFLFRLRNDLRGRVAGQEDVRDPNGMVRSRREPARRYELSYLVTALAEDLRLEHALLDAALRSATESEALPADCLPSELAEAGLPVLVRLADSEPHDLWSALGMPARAAFVLEVSAPLVPPADINIAAPAEEMHLTLARSVPPVLDAFAPKNTKRWARRRIKERPEEDG